MKVYLVNFAYEADVTETSVTMESMTEVGAPYATFELAFDSVVQHFMENVTGDQGLKERMNPIGNRAKTERIFEGQDRHSGTVRYVIVEKTVAEKVTTLPLDFHNPDLS